ncbi:uncharacterized protein LOC131996796 [Stomoxys calcitrans]|uniref:uncharacterized protein LOC131996796 n=1 Tax=Stomoxys calcitrans TaxID=35570 RepID=UPI0027E251EF|nr:uncharacterized protein LOC131996796 [Stomoxys calcitrans]
MQNEEEVSLEKHAIKLVDGAVPVKDKHYSLPHAVQEIVYKEIDNMLALKVIEESNGPSSNRTSVVRKPGKNRFSLDARKVNALTMKDAYSLRNIDLILSRIDQTFIISSVDLKYAFWQIELEVDAKLYSLHSSRSTSIPVPGNAVWVVQRCPSALQADGQAKFLSKELVGDRKRVSDGRICIEEIPTLRGDEPR